MELQSHNRYKVLNGIEDAHAAAVLEELTSTPQDDYAQVWTGGLLHTMFRQSGVWWYSAV